MGFTIEVEKRSKDEDFTFTQLKMWHQECYGGVIAPRQTQESDRKYATLGWGDYDATVGTLPLWTLCCARCESRVYLWDDEVLDIVKTAVDAQERTTRVAKAKVSQKR